MATATSTDEREEALQNLLISLFDADSLRRWVRVALGPDTHAELPGQEVSLAALAFHVALAIGARGLATTAMFDSLVARTPAREADIGKVAQFWLIEPGSVAPSPRRPSARDTAGPSASVASAVPLASLASGAILALTERPLVLSLICIGLCPILTAHSVESIRGPVGGERGTLSRNKFLYLLGLLIMVIPSLCFGMFEGWATNLSSAESRGTFAGYASIAVLLSLFIGSSVFMSYSLSTFRLAMGAALLGVGALSLSAYASSTSSEAYRGALHRSPTEPAAPTAPAALQVDVPGVDPKDRSPEKQMLGLATYMDDVPGAIQQTGQQPGTVESPRGPAAGKLKTGGGQGKKSGAFPCPDSALIEAAAGDPGREEIQILVGTTMAGDWMKESTTLAMQVKESMIQGLRDESIATIEESSLNDISAKNSGKTTYIMEAALHPPVWKSESGILKCDVYLSMLANADGFPRVRGLRWMVHVGGGARLETEMRNSAMDPSEDDVLVSECFVVALERLIPCKFVPAMLLRHREAQAE
jgi:hypothetical protein